MLDGVARTGKQLDEESLKLRIPNEVGDYKFLATKFPCKREEDPSKWWENHGTTFPRLRELVRYAFSAFTPIK